MCSTTIRASAVYLGASGDDADTGTLIRALHDQLGGGVKILTSETFIPIAQPLRHAGTAARSLHISGPLAPTGPLPPAGRQFLTRFAATQHGTPVNPASLYAAQATELMIDAIAHSNGTRSSVAGALLNTCAKNAIIEDSCINADGNPTVAPVTILTANRPGALQQLDTTGTKVVDVIDAMQSPTG